MDKIYHGCLYRYLKLFLSYGEFSGRSWIFSDECKTEQHSDYNPLSIMPFKVLNGNKTII